MRLSDFHHKHRGRPAFVLGSGPSLHGDRLDPLKGHVTFAVNASLTKARWADYFVSDNPGIIDWEYFHKTLPLFRGHCFLNRAAFEPYSTHLRKLTLYDTKPWFDAAARARRPEALRVSDDPLAPLVEGRSSCGVAVHLAHLMGCSPIVLLGTDCCYQQDRATFWQFAGEYKPTRLRNHRGPLRTYLHRMKYVDDDLRELADYWRDFAHGNPALHVINASPGGLLDCFPKMSLSDVLSRAASLATQPKEGA